jgi:hypothetical protein
MMRRNLAGDAHTIPLAAANGLQSCGRGEMSHVQMSAGLCRQGNIAFHDVRFRFRRHSSQAQPECGCALIHGAAGAQGGIFRMLDHRHTGLCRSTQCFTHDVGIENGFAIVGDGNCSRILQGLEIGEPFASAANGSGRNREHIH